jgi:toxin CcdB
MPDQLSVHRNPGRNKAVIPFVVTVQSNRFRTSAHRRAFGIPDSDVGSRFVLEGQDVVLDPLQITNVPHKALGPAVASLVDDGDRVMFALDVLLSRAWR